MLTDYINEYIIAKHAGNEKAMRRIERELESFGMDKYTLDELVKEFENREEL